MDNLTVEECYKILNLSEGATLEDIDKSYYQQITGKLKAGNKEELAQLRQAHLFLTEYYRNLESQKLEQEYQKRQQNIFKKLTENLKPLAIKTQVKQCDNYIKIRIKNISHVSKKQILKIIYDDLTALLTDEIKVVVEGLGRQNKIIWEEELHINSPVNYSSHVLEAEAEIKTHRFAFLLVGAIALAFSFSPILVWFISLWIHELGHASIAWFSGYRAMITFAATIVSYEHSLFVYFGILFLLILTGFSLWKEQKKNSLIVVVILIIIQFILTWVIPRKTYEMLLAFGGIGGEFYLSTLFIISFYWELPKRLYWEFWRFVMLTWGGITFWGSWIKWRQIAVGKEQIPWGTFWQGRGDSGGDLNILTDQHGWTINQIINVYNTLGTVCLLIIIIVYFYNIWICDLRLQIKVNQFLNGKSY